MQHAVGSPTRGKVSEIVFGALENNKGDRNRTDDRVFTLEAVIDRPLLAALALFTERRCRSVERGTKEPAEAVGAMPGAALCGLRVVGRVRTIYDDT